MARKPGDLYRYEPTDKDRDEVEMMAALGLTQEQIGHVKGISTDTVRNHFSAELERGTPSATHKVGRALFQKALDGDTTAMIFWLKARAKWRDRHELEVVGKGGGPVQVERKGEMIDRLVTALSKK